MADSNNSKLATVGGLALLFFFFNAYEMMIREVTLKAPSPSFMLLPATNVIEEEEDILSYNNVNQSTWKTIVYVGGWFEAVARHGILNMTTARCPYTRCNFTKDPKARSYADLVIFSYDKHPRPSEQRGHPGQMFGCANVESPVNRPSFSKNCDWLLSYAETSHLPSGYYGHFLPINYTARPLPGNKIDTSSVAYQRLLVALAGNASLESVIGEEKMALFKNKTKIVTWMSSHCPTLSKREILTKQLREYLPVDVFGTCGNRPCFGRSPLDANCWQKQLYKYNFYLSMENSLCPDYLTEKVYLPMLYGLIPVVYGGANYSQNLPPHSYIDAATLGVKALAKLLLSLENDPRQLERYHMWRGFYDAYTGGSMCDLCAALHNPRKNIKQRIPAQNSWAKQKAKCMKPPKSFQEPWVL